MRFALVCMPFCSALRPSLALGLLKAVAVRDGHEVACLYPNLALAKQLGTRVYERLSLHRGNMTGEWLFAKAAFGGDVPRSEFYLQEFPEEAIFEEDLGAGKGFFANLRDEILPLFIKDCLERYDWGSFQGVGFTSTFQQNVASLALARELKTLHPHITIVFGGSNMEGIMGEAYRRAFPWIDHCISGEGELAFLSLLRSIASTAQQTTTSFEDSSSEHPGKRSTDAQLGPVVLDELPPPCFDDYFVEADALGLLEEEDYLSGLPFESSRGCWWGAKHHCTFCGLNGQTMRFRSKRPERLRQELDYLAARYRITSFEATDNILDLNYLSSVFLELEKERLSYEFFYEVKANLTKPQLCQMFRAGVRRIQPGIESMNSEILRLMRKGTTALQNLVLLKWCAWLGMEVSWNLLHGFEGETREDYEKQLCLLRRIPHLQPPIGCFRLWLERYSPLFQSPEAYGVAGVRPKASYFHSYPAHLKLQDAAYFFDYETANSLADGQLHETKNCVHHWLQRWRKAQRPSLSYRLAGGGIFVDDLRDEASPQHDFLEDPFERQVFLAVSEKIQKRGGEALPSTRRASELLEDWDARGWIWGENERFFGLAVPHYTAHEKGEGV